MLKISVLEAPEVVTIKLDGRLGGLWTRELDRIWRGLALSLNPRTLSVDLCDVTYVDTEGNQLLRKIYNESDVIFVTNTPLSRYFAAEAMCIAKKEN